MTIDEGLYSLKSHGGPKTKVIPKGRLPLSRELLSLLLLPESNPVRPERRGYPVGHLSRSSWGL